MEVIEQEADQADVHPVFDRVVRCDLLRQELEECDFNQFVVVVDLAEVVPLELEKEEDDASHSLQHVCQRGKALHLERKFVVLRLTGGDVLGRLLPVDAAHAREEDRVDDAGELGHH